MRDAPQGRRTDREHGHPDGEAAPEAGIDLGSDLGPLFDDLAVRRFEARVADREAPPLISGLTEHLVAAGADPTDVVDDDEIIEDVSRLQSLAATKPTHPWHRHRR
ncbi:MAG: hypothetical protein ACRDYW_12700 [Acidimicrobiales bacterium]